MSEEFNKPRIVISKCIEHEHCRYNKHMIASDVVKKLKGLVEFIPVCPEVEIGLGIPRHPIRLVSIDNEIRLYQPQTELDHTKKMLKFSTKFCSKLGDIDGFVLKNRSPSCGISDVKVYTEKGIANLPKTSGIFGKVVQETFSDLPIEDEGRLNNAVIRERFLIKIFTLARFRIVKESKKISKLVEFQSQYKYLLMAFNPEKLKELGKIVASYKKDIKPILNEYESTLHSLFEKNSSFGKNINVLEHIFGYVSKFLEPIERKYFKELLDEYRSERITLITVLSVLKTWVLRYNKQYILKQNIWEPFPKELQVLNDSGKSRNY